MSLLLTETKGKAILSSSLYSTVKDPKAHALNKRADWMDYTARLPPEIFQKFVTFNAMLYHPKYFP